MTAFTLEKSDNWKTSTGMVRSLQCDGHDATDPTKVHNASITCHAEGTNYYAKGVGSISYNYNNPTAVPQKCGFIVGSEPISC